MDQQAPPVDAGSVAAARLAKRPRTRETAAPAATPAAAAVHVESLLIVDFAAGGNSADYLAHGWGEAEERFAWTLGERSALRLPRPWDRLPRVLELDVNPCRHHPVVGSQTLHIRINGRSFGCHALTWHTLIRCRLDPALWDGRDLITVAFAHPGFVVPSRLRMSEDVRPLAIAFCFARFYAEGTPRPPLVLPTLPPLLGIEKTIVAQAEPDPEPGQPGVEAAAAADGTPGVVHRFGTDGTLRAAPRDGWAAPEPGFQWTGTTFARLDLPAPAFAGPYLLRLDITPFLAPPLRPSQEIAITLDGRVLAQLSLAGHATLGLPLPDGPRPAGEPIRLGFHIPDALRPLDAGTGSDARLLGLCFHAVTIEALAPRLRALAGRRVDEHLPPDDLLVEGRFCQASDADLPAMVAATLGMTPAALLDGFEILGDAGLSAEDGMLAALCDALRARLPHGGMFVVKRARPLALAEMLPLWQALDRVGHPALLYVVPGAPDGCVGQVEQLAPGLLRGQIAAFAPGADETAIGAADWLRLAANAWALSRGDAAVRRMGPIATPPDGIAADLVTDPLAAITAADPDLDAVALLRDFESLGEDDAFGAAQTQLGLEVRGLFRSAAAPLAGVLAAFDDDFAALFDPAAMTLGLSRAKRPEYLLEIARYGIIWPTGIPADTAKQDPTLARQAARLGYLGRKFRETLRTSHKIYVIRCRQGFAAAELRRVHAAISRNGRNSLLFVTPDAPAAAAGRVARVAPGLLHGALTGFAAPGEATADWLRLVVNAWQLHQMP